MNKVSYNGLEFNKVSCTGFKFNKVTCDGFKHITNVIFKPEIVKCDAQTLK